MPQAAYPTGTDLANYLIAAGFTTTFVAALDTDTFAAAGASQFEREAGRKMLAVAGTRSFDRPSGAGGTIDLRDDLASGETISLTDLGTALVLNTDYVFEPLDAAGRGTPYDRLRFRRRVWNYSLTIAPAISITGSWGYASEIPDDAWVGMLAFAGMLLFPQIIQRRTGGMEAWTEADMSERYGTRPLQGLQTGWQAVTLATAGGLDDKGVRRWGKYARVQVG